MSKPPRFQPPVIPCEKKEALKEQIDRFAEVIQTEAHTLSGHALSEEEFYKSGLLQGAIQRIRGQYSATMRDKRNFVAMVLRHMEDNGYIKEWISAGGKNRHDYTVTMPDGRISVIELKGCMDGNNTTIFVRPPHAQEFIVWSVCISLSSDPRKNAWSGIHSRLGVQMIEENQQVDGLIVWDWLCGTPARPCPKLKRAVPGIEPRLTTVGQYQLAPPCVYVFPNTIPSERNNPNPEPHKLEDVKFLAAVHKCFGGYLDEVNKVRIKMTHKDADDVRTTSVERDGQVLHTSRPTPIRRT